MGESREVSRGRVVGSALHLRYEDHHASIPLAHDRYTIELRLQHSVATGGDIVP